MRNINLNDPKDRQWVFLVTLNMWLGDRMKRFLETYPENKLFYAGGPAQFVLCHGNVWPLEGGSTIEAGNFIRGPIGCCYGNAIVNAARFGLRYVEGYAMTPYEHIAQHAWNTDEKGNLIECTWPVPGLIYVGVEFSVERADDCTWIGDATVLDDYKRGWPLLKQQWKGEQEGIVWPKSTRLEMMRGTIPIPNSYEEFVNTLEGGRV